MQAGSLVVARGNVSCVIPARDGRAPTGRRPKLRKTNAGVVWETGAAIVGPARGRYRGRVRPGVGSAHVVGRRSISRGMRRASAVSRDSIGSGRRRRTKR